MKNEKKIEKWLQKNDEKLMISGNIGDKIGYGVKKDGHTVELTKGAVVLIKASDGVKILTSHPIE